MVQPFAGLAHVSLSNAQVSETGGDAALHGGHRDARATYGAFGIRTQAALGGEDLRLRFTGSAAVRHAFGDRSPTIDLAFATGPSFRIAGAAVDRDSIAIDAGLEADLSETLAFGVSYTGSYGDHSTDHGARAVLNWRF